MNPDKSNWSWWLLKLSRQMWFRAVSFALLGVVGALLAVAVGPMVPPGLATRFGPGALSNILEILASSMLLVATFSLSTVISVYSAVSSNTTPRVTELLLQDPTAQNALSTFVGAFLFALVGIIGLSADIYGESGHVVLFALTIAMVVVIVVTFLRWVHVLSNFGRLPDAIDRTARAAAEAVAGRIKHPYLGGCPTNDDFETSFEVKAGRMGYVQYVDMPALQKLAEAGGGEILVYAQPGAFLDLDQPVVCTTFEPDEEGRRAISEAFDIADNRTFDQDPEYGVSAMAEIGIKSLSPAVNDPVTAIRVIDGLVGVLTDWGNRASGEEPHYDRVHVPPVDADELFDVAFSQLALYCARDVRVGVRLQEALRSLSRVKDPKSAVAACRQAARALKHAKVGNVLEEDFARLRKINESIQAAGDG